MGGQQEKSQKAKKNEYKGRVYARYGQGCTRDCVYAYGGGRVVSANDKGKEKEFHVLHGETNVDQEVTTATGDERHRCRRKEDGDLASKVSTIQLSRLGKQIRLKRTRMRQTSEPRRDMFDVGVVRDVVRSL